MLFMNYLLTTLRIIYWLKENKQKRTKHVEPFLVNTFIILHNFGWCAKESATQTGMVRISVWLPDFFYKVIFALLKGKKKIYAWNILRKFKNSSNTYPLNLLCHRNPVKHIFIYFLCKPLQMFCGFRGLILF